MHLLPESSFVNTNAEAWDAPDQNMAVVRSTSNLLKWQSGARKALPEDAPLDGRIFRLPPMPESRRP